MSFASDVRSWLINQTTVETVVLLGREKVDSHISVKLGAAVDEGDQDQRTLPFGRGNRLDSGFPAGKLHFATRAFKKENLLRVRRPS